MKRRKSRVQEVGVTLLRGYGDVYFISVPYDKKGRIIPSSVECAYNSRYFTAPEVTQMTKSL